MKTRMLVVATVMLSACTSEPPQRFSATTPPPSERVRISYETVSVREVTLPNYASDEEISLGAADGSVSSSAALWADDPIRAVTFDIARALTEITNTQVAPDPWPFQSRPEVVVDVRFQELIPTASGQYRAVGLYFVAPDDDEDRVAHAHKFELSAPYDAADGFGSLAASRARLMDMLALDIAQRALR